MINLTPQLTEQILDAFSESFDPDSLEKRVMRPLGTMWKEISDARDYRSRILQLVEWADRRGRLDELLRMAYDANPRSSALRLLNEATGLVPPTGSLVEVIRPVLPDVNVNAWMRALTDVTKQICAVKTRAPAEDHHGTGFLVGPDQILTHFEVLVEKATDVAGALKRGGISVAFDRTQESERAYQVLSEPVLVSEGGVIVLRLDRPVGRETTPDPEGAHSGRARGWLTPPAEIGGIRAVIIAQYAENAQPKISIDTSGLVDGTVSETIRYRTATHPGSMGAPCFDENWRFIGMHVGVDSQRHNYGIGVGAIVRQLSDQGCLWDVSSGVHRDPAQVRHDKPQGNLDALVRGFEILSDAESPDDDVWSDDGDRSPSDPDRWAWAEAAAVTADFDPETLEPAGDPPEEARVAILLESAPIRTAGGVTRWMLSEPVRVRALERLASRGTLQETRIRATRRESARESPELLDVVLGNLIREIPPGRADLQDPDRLRAMLQVSGWLARTGLKLPSTAMLSAALERAMLIAPFRHLTRGFFAGRETEVATLAAYVDGPDVGAHGVAPPPIFIYGPGGMGKSALLAHFILAHSDRDTTRTDSWRPFVYLDFDRPELDARDLSGVLLAIARQVGPQVPSVQGSVNDLLATLDRRRRAQRPRTTALPKSRRERLLRTADAGDVDKLLGQVAEILNAVHRVLPSPLVLVIDTLEEVQYATPDAVVPLAELVVKLRAAVPSLRPVLSGRIEVDAKAGLTPIPLGPLSQGAAEALLGNHLPPALAAKTDLVTRMVQIVGGNPLSLRLAADVLSREADQNVAALGEEALWQLVGDSIVQGRLYERIVGHIHEGPIQTLAIPGLVLRYLTWELIRDVLARPCGVEVKDDDDARALFNQLAKEIAVVRRTDDPAKLELRPELRRTVLADFRKDVQSADRRRMIHEAAVDFYAPLPGPENRAEEIYHRLWLDQEPSEIDARWLTGVDLPLRGAVEELEGRARAYLASRVGGVDDEAIARSAGPAEWEAYAEKRASDLLRMGSPQAALEVLRMRSDRLPTSRLHLIESIALRSIPHPDFEAAEKVVDSAVSAAKASRDPSEIQSALQELVQIRRLRHDTAGVLRALAELGDLGEQLGDDLILLEAEVSRLEAEQPVDRLERFSDSAVRVFGRLPDELVARAPELARRVAAQAGAANPSILQRVIRLVGLGPLNRRDVEGLERTLAYWAQRDEGIASFVPKAPASATELTSATQYLLANRSLDSETASALSAWLQTVVTPHAPAR